MGIISEIIIAIAVCAALLGVVCAARGMLLTPVRRNGDTDVFTVVRTGGDAEGLEQIIDGLLWLRDSGKAETDIIIACDGLSEEAAKRAELLCEKCGGMLCAPENLAVYTEDRTWRTKDT